MSNDRRGVKEGAQEALRARLERALETQGSVKDLDLVYHKQRWN